MESSNLIYKEKSEKNQIKSVVKYENIKSTYILKNIFNNLEEKKLLNIAKYNKRIMKRIDININHYKAYSEEYSSIELDIIPVKDGCGKFINIKEKDKKYFLIYFNDNKKKKLKIFH